jgi:hypothetical protein
LTPGSVQDIFEILPWRKENLKVLLTINLNIALIKCSQELKNAYQVDLLTANNITSTAYAWRGYFIVLRPVLATYTAKILLK